MKQGQMTQEMPDHEARQLEIDLSQAPGENPEQEAGEAGVPHHEEGQGLNMGFKRSLAAELVQRGLSEASAKRVLNLEDQG